MATLVSDSPAEDIQPILEELNDLKESLLSSGQFCIPKRSQERKRTDTTFLLILTASLLFLLSLLGYILPNTDIRRTDIGSDHCGNICGEKNEPVMGINCSGKDTTNYKYLYMKFSSDDYTTPEVKECVHSCNESYLRNCEHFYNRLNLTISDCICQDANDIWTKSADGIRWVPFEDMIEHLILVVVISMVLCAAMLLYFKYSTECAICITNVVPFVILVGLIIFICSSKETVVSQKRARIIGPTTIVLFGTIVYKICGFAGNELLSGIFKEGIKIALMPVIIFQSLLTMVASLITISSFLIATRYMLSATNLIKKNDYLYTYQLTPLSIFTICFNVFMTLWMVKFIMACQTIVIAGTVSSWYFSSDQTNLKAFGTSMINLIKYHLGSAALGPLVLTAVNIPKSILIPYAIDKSAKCCVSCCYNFVRSLVYISKHAYLYIAMHGDNFLKSGRRAVQLLCMNLGDVLALNRYIDSTLFITKLNITLLTIILTKLILTVEKNFCFEVLISALISGIISHCIFSAYRTVIHTILLCYSEDCLLNSELGKCYLMSDGLKQFVQESKTKLAMIVDPNPSSTTPLSNDNNPINSVANIGVEDPLFRKYFITGVLVSKARLRNVTCVGPCLECFAVLAVCVAEILK